MIGNFLYLLKNVRTRLFASKIVINPTEITAVACRNCISIYSESSLMFSDDSTLRKMQLFGHIKQLLAGHEFPDREALLGAVRHILEGIQKGSLDGVFLTWMERLEQCIPTSGGSVEQIII
jgi:hypothetical protein